MRAMKLAGSLFLFTLPLLAQSDRGTITGTIADPAGAVVANAPIEVRNLETGAVYNVGSSATGNYVVQVPAGTYHNVINAYATKPLKLYTISPDTWSKEATVFASWIVSRWITRQTPVATLSFLVTAAAMLNETNGSIAS